MAISRQKEARSRDYALLLFRMTSRVFIVHSMIGSTVHSRPLNSLQHCICTTMMTNIRPDRDSHLQARSRDFCVGGRFKPKVDLSSTFVSATASRMVRGNVSSALFFKYKTPMFCISHLLKHKKLFNPYAELIRLPNVKAHVPFCIDHVYYILGLSTTE